MDFPNDKDQFAKLLHELGVADVDLWVSDRSAFSKELALQYLFLRSIWMFMENPNESTYAPEKVARERAWSEGHPSRSLKKFVPITEKMLAAGIEPDEISMLVYLSQSNLVFQILYMLDDNDECMPVDLGDMEFGLFETKGEQPIGGGWFIDDLLGAARPSSFPEWWDS